MAAADIFTAKQYLRRKFSANLPGLKELADKIAEGAFDQVTITGQTFEGSSHQGQLTFPRMQYLQAIEELIIELDPSPVLPPSTTVYPDFSQRPVQL